MKELFETIGTKVCMTDNFSDLSYKVGSLGNNVLWVCDSNTARMVRPLPEPNVILAPGENSKNWQTVERILSTASDARLSRESYFISLGGGVVSDITAFAASIFQRGCKVVLIPTTLLSMVDASIGGKTGINFQNAKNQIGTFYPASEVIICPDCLKSLSQKEYLNGLAEVLKHAILSQDSNLFDFVRDKRQRILDRDLEILKTMLEMSLNVKKHFIEQDPKEENGIRSALNLGHTFGHALESLTHMQWSHGQAVAWGITRAVGVSLELGLCPVEFERDVYQLFENYGYNVSYRIDRGDWLSYASYLNKDKKRFDGNIQYILPTGIGNTVKRELEEETIRKFIIRPTI